MSEQRPVIDTAGLWPAYVDAGYVEKLRGYVAANITPEGDRIDREDVYPTGIMKDLARSRFSTVVMDTEFGGEGLSYPHAVALCEEVAVGSAAVGVSLITIFQAQTMLRRFGAESLK